VFRIQLPSEKTSLLLTPQWQGLAPALQWGLILLVSLVPLALILFLYRYELRLVHRGTAFGLLTLRLVVLALLLFLVCLQPVYARDRTVHDPGRVLVAVDRSDSMDVADPQREPAEKLRLARALKLGGDLCTDAQLTGWIQDHEHTRTLRWLNAEEEKLDPVRRRELEVERLQAHDKLCERVDALTRTQTARRILGDDGQRLLATLAAAGHQVDLLGFHRDSWELNPDQIDELFRPADRPEAGPGRASDFTDLRQPLLRALERSGPDKGKVLGVVVLTDGQHNVAELPTAKARELGDRRLPVHPIALGARKPPPDVAVVSVQSQPTVFKDVDANIDVRFKVTGLKRQDFSVKLYRAGKERKLLEERVYHHDGDDQYHTEHFQLRLDQAGTQTVIATVEPLDPQTRETSKANNSRPTVINVADDKAKVLLVDGEARWEYHYLATALQRDRTIQLQTVVFDQPRLNPQLTPAELEQMGSPRQQLPPGPDGLAPFDCVILGDVTPAQMPLADRQRLEKYVADRGGTLVLVAGKRALPLGYPDNEAGGEADPLRKLLPIESPRVVASAEGFPLTFTQEGKDTAFLRLDPEADKNDKRWSEMRRHFWGVVGQAKPGAATLAYHADPALEARDARSTTEHERQNALIVRQNYGFGRVLYVGLDSTWRWRYKTGDLYHHTFWGQAIRWAATDKPLVTGNEFVRFGTPKPVYGKGEDVEVVLRLNDELGPLPADLLAGARILRPGDPGQKETAVAMVPLTRKEAQPRTFEGKAANLPPGPYAIEMVLPGMADKLNAPAEEGKPAGPLRATFTVLPPDSTEMTDLETKWPLLEEIAVKSGGNRVFTPEDASELVDLLAKQTVPRVEHHEQPLWQWWILLVVVIGLMTVEWIGRKLAGLP
jgi:hypothetical protein